jgi:hypothetical protein
MPKSSKLKQILAAIPTMTTANLRKCLDKENRQLRMKAYAEMTRRKHALGR